MSLVTFYPAGQIVHINILVCLCLIKKEKFLYSGFEPSLQSRLGNMTGPKEEDLEITY